MSDFNPNYWGAKIRAAAQSAEPAMTSEREAFEKWAKYKWFDLHRNKDNESYTDPQTHRMWESWQARAHLSQPAQAVDGCELRTFAGWLREDGQHYWADRLDELADKLTAALPNANGKEDTDAAR